MVFDKFKRLIKFNNENYWYDDENQYFYVPNTNNQKLKLLHSKHWLL